MTLLTTHPIADNAIAKAKQAARTAVLPQTSAQGIANVRAIEAAVLATPQIDCTTYHTIHAGIYSRTIMIPRGVILTGALIKVPTTLVINGKCAMLVDGEREALVDGYAVIAASAHRIQSYIAHEDTWLTMSFKTNARTVEEAENEFTDEAHRLLSRYNANEVLITED